MINWLYLSSDFITITTGSTGIYPSFKGTIGAFSFGCGRIDNYPMLGQTSETKLKGLWYFDENSLPRPNIANPYNLEPKFIGHPIDQPIWDSGLNRWRVHDGKKFVLEFGNFLDFRATEILRSITVVVDFRIMTPLAGSISVSTTWTEIGTLSSDIEIPLLFQYDGTKYRFKPGYRKTNGDIQVNVGTHMEISINFDFIWVVTVTRSLSDPTTIWFSFQQGIVTGSNISYYTQSE